MPKQERPSHLGADNDVLRRHRDVLTNLARLAATPTVGREEFFQSIANSVADAVEIDHVKVLRFRPEHGDLFMEAGVGWKPGIVRSVAYPADMASHAGRSFQTAMPVLVDDLENTDFRVDPSLADHGIRSLVDVPIELDGAAWGVLEADSTTVGKFNDDTTAFLTAAATLVGLLIVRTRVERAHEDALTAQVRDAQRRKLLLSEMQHRVKNNFQMILAMIDLRARTATQQDTRAAMKKLADNVMAMALAHNQLSPAEEEEKINLAGYLTALTSNIEKPIEGVTVEIEANEMEVGIDQAVPLGLIVNEAITNAVKHAFDGQGGKIRVELLNHGHGEALLSVCDNGKGYPAKPSEGSGAKLLEALARQVRGKIDRLANDGGGTIVRVIFPRTAVPST